jgi:class 3 adenylate cyclase
LTAAHFAARPELSPFLTSVRLEISVEVSQELQRRLGFSMNDRTNRTVICSIAFLDIVDYSKRVGQEQLQLKERFNSLISEVIKDIAQNDRVLIDTGDGAALCFMGDPEDALFVSMNLRDRLRTPESEAIGLTVRFGINLGPVRMITDINDHQNVIGDGINVAQRVMSFAEPNQIMVSRSYFEVVSRLSQEYTLLFHYAGARTDKHVREHEVYEVGPGKDDEPVEVPMAATPSQAASIAAPPPPEPAPAAATATAASAPAKKRNKWLVPAALAAVVVLAIAIFAGTKFKSSDKASEPVRAEKAPAMKQADQVPPQALASASGAKTDTETKSSLPPIVLPPVGGPSPGAKTDVEAKMSAPAAGLVPGAKTDAAGKALPPAAGLLPGAKTDAMGKPLPPGAKTDADAKSAAAKAKAQQLDAAKAQQQQTDPSKAQPLDPSKALPPVAAAAKKNEPGKDNVPAKAAGGTGTLEFWVNPWGDVFVDGKQVGTAPPLKVYKLPPGSHKVEIYNDSAGFPFKTTVEVKADQVTRINQTFR